MKLSTRSRYGLKAVIDLAVRYGSGPVSLPTLAGEQGVSEGYLEQLLRELKKGGVVHLSGDAIPHGMKLHAHMPPKLLRALG